MKLYSPKYSSVHKKQNKFINGVEKNDANQRLPYKSKKPKDVRPKKKKLACAPNFNTLRNLFELRMKTMKSFLICRAEAFFEEEDLK